jgi:hypothetical protein
MLEISKSAGIVMLMLLFGGSGFVVLISKFRFVFTLIDRLSAVTET